MEAIQHILGAKVAKDVKRSAILPALCRPPRNKILLVDEPGELLDENARRFLEDCQVLTDKKKTSVVVAMTPREYGQLETAAGGNRAAQSQGPSLSGAVEPGPGADDSRPRRTGPWISCRGYQPRGSASRFCWSCF